MENVVGENRGVYRGEVDATCVQMAQGEENYTLEGGRIPQIYG